MFGFFFFYRDEALEFVFGFVQFSHPQSTHAAFLPSPVSTVAATNM